MGYEKVISPMFFYGSAAYFLSSTLEEKKSLDAPFSGFWAYGIHENAPESIARITVEKPVA